jgi:hypothetical protein
MPAKRMVWLASPSMVTSVSAPTIGDDDMGREVGGGDAESGQLDQILAAGWIGIEISNAIIAEAGLEHERVGVRAAIKPIATAAALEHISELIALDLIVHLAADYILYRRQHVNPGLLARGNAGADTEQRAEPNINSLCQCRVVLLYRNLCLRIPWPRPAASTATASTTC